MSASQPPASEQYESWKRHPNVYSEPTHRQWLAEVTSLRAALAAIEARMVHQHRGPYVGWTLDDLLPGDSPSDAIRALQERANPPTHFCPLPTPPEAA